MLTGRLVRVRHGRDLITPLYLDASDPRWLAVADRLLELFRGREGRTRGDLVVELRETFGSDPTQLVHQGLAKLLEDRCDYEVVSGHPPQALREAVFRAAAIARRQESGVRSQEEEDGGQTADGRISSSSPLTSRFDPDAVLRRAADELSLTLEGVEQGLFADLKSEQRLVRFTDLSPERLLRRYNVALAQGVLLRATRVRVEVRGEPPRRYRQLLRQVKFHRLVCEVDRLEDGTGQALILDGPLSLFAATQKYGLQLALFVPAVLGCNDFALLADVLWGPQRRPKTFRLTSADGLEADGPDQGMYVPAEIVMFAEGFRTKVADWEIVEETDVRPLGDGFWVPDYRLTHRPTGRCVYLEILGYWRKASVDRHLERLRQHAREPFVLAVSDQLRVDDGELAGLPAGVHRFRQMPRYEAIARLAMQVIGVV